MSEWIKCKDKIPDKDGRYIVASHFNWTHVEICSLRKGRWDSSNVYAWMELPEAPEVSDECH